MDSYTSESESESEAYGGHLVFFLKNEITYNLTEGKTTIGSSLDANIRFTSIPRLAPIHSIIEVDENGIATLFIKQADESLSVNKTIIKEFHVLRNGDYVEFLGKKFQYHNDLISDKEIDKFIEEKLSRKRRNSEMFPMRNENSPTKNKKSISRKSTLENESKKGLHAFSLSPNLNLPSPILPLKRRSKSLLTKVLTPDPTKFIRAKSLTSVTTPNQIRRSFRSSKIMVDQNLSLTENNDEQSTSQSLVKTPSENKSKVGTPNQSRMSQRSINRSRSILNSSLNKTRPKKSINLDMSPTKMENKLSKSLIQVKTSDQSKASPKSRRYTVHNTLVSSKASSDYTKPKRSLMKEDDTQNTLSESLVKTPNQSRMSSRSRKSTKQSECILEESLGSSASPRKSKAKSEDDSDYLENVVLSPTPSKCLNETSNQSQMSSRQSHYSRMSSLPTPNQSWKSGLRGDSVFEDTLVSYASSPDLTRPNESKTSSRSRRSTVQGASSLDSSLASNPTSPDRARPRKSEAKNKTLLDDSENNLTSSTIEKLSKSSAQIQTADESQLSRSKKSAVKESSILNYSLVSNASSPERTRGRKSETKNKADLGFDSSSTNMEKQTLNESKMSSRSRKSTAQEESLNYSLVSNGSSPDRTGPKKSKTVDDLKSTSIKKLSKSLAQNQTPTALSPERTKTRKSEAQNKTVVLEDLENDFVSNNINKLSKSFVQNQTPNKSKMSSISKRSAVQGENITNYSLVSNTSTPYQTRTKDKIVLNDLMSSNIENQSLNKSKMTSRSRSVVQGESIFDYSLMSSASPARSNTRKSEAKNTTLLNDSEKDLTSSNTGKLSKSVAHIQTPNESKMSSKSRQSAVQGENILDYSLMSTATSPDRTRTRNSEVRNNQDGSVNNLSLTNQRKMSKSLTQIHMPNESKMSRSRRSNIQGESNFDFSLMSNASSPDRSRTKKSKDKNTIALDNSKNDITSSHTGYLSKSLAQIQTPNESRMSSISVQGDSFMSNDLSPENTLPRKSNVKNISALDDLSTTKLSKSVAQFQTPTESKIFSRSRRSTVPGDSIPSYPLVSNASTPVWTRPRKSGAKNKTAPDNIENDLSSNNKNKLSKTVAQIETHNESKMSRSRTSTNQGESVLDYSFVSNASSPDRSKTRKSEANSIIVLDDSENDITSSHSTRISKSLAQIQTPNESKISLRSRQSTVQGDSVMSNDSSPEKTSPRKSDVKNKTALDDLTSVQLSKSLAQIRTPNESKISSRSRRSTVLGESIPSYPLAFNASTPVWTRPRKSEAINKTVLVDMESDLSSTNIRKLSKSLAQIEAPNESKMSSRSRKSAVQEESTLNYSLVTNASSPDRTMPKKSKAENDLSSTNNAKLSKSSVQIATPNQSKMSSRSRRSTIQGENILDYSLVSNASSSQQTRLTKSLAKEKAIQEDFNGSTFLVQNRKSRLSKSMGQNNSNLDDYTFTGQDKSSLKDDSSPSKIVRRSKNLVSEDQTRIIENNPADIEGNSSPVQFQFRIANSLLSRTQTPIKTRFCKSTDDSDFPSPILPEDKTAKYLTKLQTPDNSRRSSRSRKSALIDDFDYSASKRGKSLAFGSTKTHIDDFTVNSTYPLGNSRRNINSSEFEENLSGSETFVKENRNSKSRRNEKSGISVITLDDTTDELQKSVLNTSQNSRNRVSLISINDTVKSDSEEAGFEPNANISGRRTKSTPYQPVTEDISPSSPKKSRKIQKSPKNDLTNVFGIKKLFHINSPKNRLSNFSGVKTLLRSPKEPLNDLTRVPNLRRIMSPQYKTQKEPSNRLSDFQGVAQIFNTSTQEISNTSDIENNEDLFSKLFNKKPLKTYRSQSWSPHKKIEDYGAMRKSIYDKPCISPRVDHWVEEQAALRQKMESSAPRTKRRKAKEAEDLGEKPEIKKFKPNTEVTNLPRTRRGKVKIEKVNVEPLQSEESSDNEPPVQRIKQVKKVTIIENVTYFPISPREFKKRRGLKDSRNDVDIEEPLQTNEKITKVEEEKPTRSRKGKTTLASEKASSSKEIVSRAKKTVVDKVNEDTPSPKEIVSRRKKTIKEKVNEETPSPKKTKRGRNVDVEQMEDTSSSKKLKLEETKKPSTRAKRGKKVDTVLEQIEVVDKKAIIEVDEKKTKQVKEKSTSEDVMEEPKKSTRAKRGQKVDKVVEHIEVVDKEATIEVDAKKTKQIKEKSSTSEDVMVEPKKSTRTKRGQKVEQFEVEATETEQDKEKSSKSKVEVTEPKKSIRARRGKQVDTVVDEKATLEIKQKKNKEVEGSKEEAIEEPKAKAKRGKKSDKIVNEEQLLEKTTDTRSKKEKKTEEPKKPPTRATKGKKTKNATKELEETEVIEEPAKSSTRPKRGKKESPVEEQNVITEKTKIVEKPSKKEPKKPPTRAKRGKKADELVEQELEPVIEPVAKTTKQEDKKSAAKSKKAKEIEVMEESNKPCTRSRRGKKT